MSALTWKRRTPSQVQDGYYADGDDVRYYARREASGWTLSVFPLDEQVGLRLVTVQYPKDRSNHDTLTLAKATATAYEAEPDEHATLGRMTRAIVAAYDRHTISQES